MNEVFFGLIFWMLLIGGGVLLTYMGCKLIDLYFWTKNKLNHTIFKEKYIEKCTNDIKECIKFNQEKIKMYKGEDYDKRIDNVEGLWRCLSYTILEEKLIDEELLNEYDITMDDVKKWCDIYFKEQRKKNLNKRIEKLEHELNDIKKRI